MIASKIKLLLVSLGTKPSGDRGKWVEAPCVLAPWRHLGGVDAHPSFGIKAEDKKKSICKCLSCGFGGDLMDLLFALREGMKRYPHLAFSLAEAASIVSSELDDLDLAINEIPEYGEPLPKLDKVFPEQWLATFKDFAVFPDAVNYIRSRGVSTGVAKELGVKFDPLQRRICFPFRNFKGELMGLQGRAIDGGVELRYYQYGYKGDRNLHCWMGESMVDLDKPVVLVEGPIDFARVFATYKNVVASFTSGLSIEKVKRISEAESVITFYDYGSGGNAARKRISEVLGKVPIKHLIPTLEEGDPGNLSDEVMLEYLEGLVPL